jgi:PPOX class probable F420-dependent enzyme
MSAKTLDSSLNSLTDHRVLDFLRLARVAHLATSSADGAPHNVPLCFWFDDVARLYFIVDEKPKRRAGTGLKRMRNIAQNPRVAIVVDHYEEEWAHLAYVLIHGEAQMVDDPKEYMLALRNLRDKYPQYRAMVLNPERNPMVLVEATRLHVWGARFKPPEPAA